MLWALSLYLYIYIYIFLALTGSDVSLTLQGMPPTLFFRLEVIQADKIEPNSSEIRVDTPIDLTPSGIRVATLIIFDTFWD